MAKATSVIDVILGEAVGDAQKATREDRYQDMLGIASTIDNRSTRGNVTPEQVVSNSKEFNAYDKALPAGVEAYRGLAEEAWAQVQNYGPVHDGMFYATPAAVDNLPQGLVEVDKTLGHVFFDDPGNRSFAIEGGKYVTPSPERQQLAAAINPLTDTALPGLSIPEVSMAAAYAPNLTNPAQYAFADILAPTPVQTTAITPYDVSLPDIAPVPSIAPEPPSVASPRGFEALAPNGLIGQSEYGRVGYAHTDRGPWDANLTPEAVDSVNMMANMSPAGIQVNSAYRDPAVNARVDGRKNSEHLRGNAYDMSLKGLSEAEKALAVEQARMSGATRVGAYKDSDIIHVDFAKGYAPKTDYAVDVHPMFDMSYNNMGAAPGWFTDGLAQTTVPTPTSRDEALAQIAAQDALTAQAYGELAASLGAAGIPNVGGYPNYSAPVGEVERSPLGPVQDPAAAMLAADMDQGLGAYADTLSVPGFEYSIAPPETVAPALAAAPVDAVERSALPDISVPSTPAVPAATTFASLPNDFTAPANTFQPATPEVPSIAPAVPASSVPSIGPAPTPSTAQAISLPDIAPTPTPAPEAPAAAREGTSLGSRLGHAAIGAAFAGLPGAVVGGLIGPAITSTAKDVLGGAAKGIGLDGVGKGLGNVFGGIGDVFSGKSNISMPENTYTVGSGLAAIDGVFNGAFGVGATAFSQGNPAISFTDLGNGQVAKTNAELGTTSIVNASSYGWTGGPQTSTKSDSTWGLGDIFGGLGDTFSGDWSGDWSGGDYSYSSPNDHSYGE